MTLLSSFTHALLVLPLFLLTCKSVVNTTINPINIPPPPGPFVTELSIQVMIDSSHPDPYNTSIPYRRLLTSIFTPVPKSECSNVCTAQYMPPVTAALEDKAIGTNQSLFERFKLSGICCSTSTPGYGDSKNQSSMPLVIWSGGFGESRLQWSAMAQYVASYGFQVILVDHPYDARITEFPNGEIVQGVFGDNPTAQQRVFALNVEIQDVLFVIDSYSKGTCGASRAYGDSNKIGIIAHGTLAAQAMLNDSLNGHPGRISGGVNLDGRFEGPVLSEGIGTGEKSFLIWVPPSGPNIPASWDQWWNITDRLNPTDWRRELGLANSTQGTFTDFPLLADISGFRATDPKAVDSTLGTISGQRSMSILTTYNTAFLQMAIEGANEPLLSGPSEAYPEVSFVRVS